MLGFSLPKLLILIAVIAVVWYGFKAAGRINRNRRSGPKKAEQNETSGITIESMVQCPKCRAYSASLDTHICET